MRSGALCRTIPPRLWRRTLSCMNTRPSLVNWPQIPNHHWHSLLCNFSTRLRALMSTINHAKCRVNKTQVSRVQCLRAMAWALWASCRVGARIHPDPLPRRPLFSYGKILWRSLVTPPPIHGLVRPWGVVPPTHSMRRQIYVCIHRARILTSDYK